MIVALSICSALTVLAGVVAAFSRRERISLTALWLAGVGLGGVYISLGAELLGMVQWLLATLSAIAFHFHSSLFGDEKIERSPRTLVLPVLGGGGLLVILMLAALPDGVTSVLELSPILETLANPPSGQRAVDLGRRLLGDHLVALEILGLCLFVSILGAGVVSRPDVVEGPER